MRGRGADDSRGSGIEVRERAAQHLGAAPAQDPRGRPALESLLPVGVEDHLVARAARPAGVGPGLDDDPGQRYATPGHVCGVSARTRQVPEFQSAYAALARGLPVGDCGSSTRTESPIRPRARRISLVKPAYASAEENRRMASVGMQAIRAPRPAHSALLTPMAPPAARHLTSRHSRAGGRTRGSDCRPRFP